MISKEQALAELEKRGYSTNDKQSYIKDSYSNSSSSPQWISKEMALSELKNRGYFNQDEPESWSSKLKSIIKAAPGELSGAYKQVVDNPKRAAKIVAASGLDTAQGIANLLSPSINHLNEINKFSPYSLGEKTDWNKKLNVGQPQKGDTALGMIPYIIAPEALETKGASALESIISKGTEGALYDKSSGGSGITGFALGSLPGVSGLAYKEAKYLPARIMRGTATPKELKENLEAAGNAKIPIGNITKSPISKRIYENTLALIPGSGVSKLQQSVSENLQNEANSIIEDLAKRSGRGSIEPNYALKSALNQVFENSKYIKNNLYNRVSSLAEKEGHNLDLSSFSKKAKDYEKLVKDSALYQGSPGIKKFINSTAGYNSGLKPKEIESQILDSTGNSIKTLIQRKPSISESNFVKNEMWYYGDSLSKSASSSERYLGGKYKEMASAIDNDINNSIKKTGSKQLQDAYKDAKSYYKNTFSGFLDKEPRKYLDDTRNSDAIAREIISPSKSYDKHSTISKIQALLPQEDKNLIGYAYLQNAVDKEGNADPIALHKLVKSLGKKQFETIFDKESQEKLANYSLLKQMSNDSLDYMRNPKTGFSNLKSWQKLVGALGVGAAAGAHVANPLAASIVAASTIGGARGLAHVMTNPKIRDTLINQMIDKSLGGTVSKQGLASKYFSKYAPRVASTQNQKENK